MDKHDEAARRLCPADHRRREFSPVCCCPALAAALRAAEERGEAAGYARGVTEEGRARAAAVVGTVGGVVEGNPTSVVNYLQRLRELVAAEEGLEHARGVSEERARCIAVLRNERLVGIDGESPVPQDMLASAFENAIAEPAPPAAEQPAAAQETREARIVYVVQSNPDDRWRTSNDLVRVTGGVREAIWNDAMEPEDVCLTRDLRPLVNELNRLAGWPPHSPECKWNQGGFPCDCGALPSAALATPERAR